LRKTHGFPREGRLGVDCVYSPERLVFPTKDGSVCESREDAELGPDGKLNCNLGLGSATFVTGAFGFAAAGWVVRRIAAT